jgi:hypothetical protein
MRTLLMFTVAAGSIFGQACDRACLEGFVDKYMDALVAHDPKLVPLAGTLKNTENGQRLEPGDGFWRTATAKGVYRLFVDDPQRGEVAFLGTMKEANIPVSVAIRLKIANQKISEIETFVVRTGMNGTNGAPELEKLGKPRAAFLEPVPAAQRVSREELIKTANMYFSGLEKNDGKGNYPVADDCDRLEDGQQTTNNLNSPSATGKMSCKAAFESGAYHYVTRIRDRRFVAVDVERGLVFAFVFFDNAAGKYRTFRLADGTETSAGPNRPWTWEIAEMFKVQGGKIHQVESLLDQVPYGMGSGWGN